MNLRPYWKEILRNTAEPGAGGAEGKAPAEPNPAPQADPSEGPDLSFIPDDFRGEDGSIKLDDFRQSYQDMLAEQAQRAEAAALVPESGEYDFALPELDFSDIDGLPEGFSVDLNIEDEDYKPLFGEAAELLKDLGAPAEVSQKLTGLLAKYKATEYAKHARAAKAEAEKLGSNNAQREARIGKVHRAMQSRLPAAQVEALMNATQTYEGVRALEALFAPRGPGATVPQPTGADLDKLSAFDRLKVINAQQQAKG